MSLIVRGLGVAILAGLAAFAAIPVVSPVEPAEPPLAAAAAVPLATIALPSTDRTAAPSLIERSPFAHDRSAFSRNAGPPAPEIEVRLAGVFKVGKEMRAHLVVGGQPIVVGKGDETLVGKVSDIESFAIVLDGPSPRRIELFKQ